ncbi:glycosyl hydrolase [Thiospirochaeta perfilievii]|uniref:Glycosyl hydrolase n=1 Tax=Thiospirochaeta perfilievii TaxID=252967 RepID=A0A5C1QAY2_9SPIO|nr:glycoside hydrolase family 3 C-terminal domain-containing protein [Thiospirochaeta perfilievii]QEN05283.1 glycosyl hydrolase [Thiospirochaeta perfilievii]
MKYQELIDKMTIDEKVSLLSGKDFWQTKSIDRLNIPSMFLADGPHGLRKQAADADHLGLNAGIAATCFPTSATIANSWDITLGERLGSALGQEALSEGVNIILGPGLNIKRSPLCGRNFEYFSEDPYLSGKMASGYIKGIQKEGIAACPKHFVANNQELFRMINDSVIDKRTLYEIYLTGFEIAVKEGNPKAIMSAYNKINGTYANEHKELLNDVLVEDWGFKGIVVSDWGGSNEHIDGVASGSHLEMPSTGGDSDRELLCAVKDGLLDEALLDKRVNEYLEVLFEIQIEGKQRKANFDLHHNIAREAAEASIVLLKNDAQILPLKRDQKVGIIGSFADKPRYQGAGSSLVNPARLENTLDEIKNRDLTFVGYESGDDILRAKTLASSVDVVLLYLGLDDASETEGLDRSHLNLIEKQIELLDNLSLENKNIVVILSGGSAIQMPWLDKCKGLIHGYLSGQAGASAMLNILTGKVNPSGKLAETYPLELCDTPVYNYYPGKEKSSEYREALYVGYRYYDTGSVDVLFPFGFGLSYTTFEYSNLEVSREGVVFAITNMGTIDGSEIVQLYIGKESKNVFRPKKELKGFKKIFLKAGESKEVSIDFDDKSFRYFDIESNQFEVESGDYKIYIAASSTDIRLEGGIVIDGTKESVVYDPIKYKKYYLGDIKKVDDDEFSSLLGHDIPTPYWDRDRDLDRNDAIAQMVYAKSGFARLIHRFLRFLKDRSIKKGKPDLNLLFIYHVPFRGIEKMMGGVVNKQMVNALLIIVNGHFFKGCRLFIKGFFNLKKLNKDTKEKLVHAEEYIKESK